MLQHFRLLGSTALITLFLSAPTALAAIPVPAPEPEPDNFVRVCDAFGDGYFYIPGTETCLRIGGQVRSEVQGGDQVYARKRGERSRETYAWLSRAALNIHTAAQTPYGVLRTFANIRSEWKAGAEFGSANDNTGGSLRLGYIELGGVRVGLDETIFAYWTGYYGNVLNDDVLNGANTRTNKISYTYAADNGFSAIIGVEQGNEQNGDGNNIYKDSTGVEGLVSADNGGYRIRADGSREFKKLSQQTHNYMPYIVAGVKYERKLGALSAVFGYDSYYSSWATKLRGDLNLTDKLSVFLMGGYKSMDDYYNLDDTYGDGGIKITGYRADGSPIKRRGIYRQINSMYGDWGGDWALWTGGSYQVRKTTSLNFQAAYSDERTFATSANVEHQILPGLSVIPEISYINWDNRYGYKYENGDEIRNSLKGKSALQGQLRVTRSF